MQGWQRTAAGPVRAEVTHEPGAAAGLSLLAGDLAGFSASILLVNLVVPPPPLAPPPTPGQMPSPAARAISGAASLS